MASIDLIGALSQFGNDGKLHNVKVYGQLKGVLNRPNTVSDYVTLDCINGKFVDFHVYAVDLSEYKYKLEKQGIKVDDGIFFVHGHIMLYVDLPNYRVGSWYRTEGTVRVSSKDGFPFLTMFKFKTVGRSWHITDNILKDFNVAGWNHNSDTYEYIQECKRVNAVVVPETVLTLPEFYAEPNNMRIREEQITYVKPVASRVTAFEDTSSFMPENRDFCKTTDLYLMVYNRLQSAKTNTGKFIDAIKAQFPFSLNSNIYIDYLLNALVNNLNRKSTSNTYTGRSLIKDYLYTCYPDMSKKDYIGMECGTYLISIFDEIVEYYRSGNTVNAEDAAYNLCLQAFGDMEKFYAFVSAKLLGKDTDAFIKIYELCYRNNISFSKLLNINPYILQCIGNLSFYDVEDIVNSLGLGNNEKLSTFRNIAILDNAINSRTNGSTIFSLDYLSTHPIGMVLTEKQYRDCLQYDTYISDFIIDNVNCFLKKIDRLYLKVDVTTFEKVGYDYVQLFNIPTLDKVLKDYLDLGLGVFIEPNYVTSTKLCEKELFVYVHLAELCENVPDYKIDTSLDIDTVIDNYIDEYEKEIGFTLETEQRKAVHLVKFNTGVITGSAGSGKTTVANCFKYVLQKLNPLAEFKYATPTGKAAKRLQEVVKQPVKTMCSMFKTFNDTDGILDVEDDDLLGKNEIYIFDENAMVTIDLLYSCLIKMQDCQIYFFGDFHQLPPIGKGLPFRNLLRFLPCQYLTVSKRAATGSNITYNSNLINEYSEPDNWRDLESGKDFFLLDCAEQAITPNTIMLVKHYLGQSTELEDTRLKELLKVDELPVLEHLSPDDIQVVTPIAKSTYSWGANKLNEVLQPIFNPIKGYNNTFIYQKTKTGLATKFLINDRVIHTNRNLYAMQWYSSFENGRLQKCYGYGINNGEVGKVVACLPTELCNIYDEIENKPADFEYPKNLRDDRNFKSDNTYFLVVQYYDYMTDKEYYILYRCEENFDVENSTGKVIKGEDLSMLNLFYAGTTHKMQGSQARLIIAPLGDITFKGFITRNMMYTVYTRGIDCVFSLGSIYNDKKSMLSRARMEVSETNILTVGEILFRSS